MAKCDYNDPLDVLTNEIEQGFMQRGGWKACRYALGKLVAAKDAIVDTLPKMADGVHATPGAKVYCYDPAGGLQGYDVTLIARDDSSCPSQSYLAWGNCYSSEEAAWKEEPDKQPD